MNNNMTPLNQLTRNGEYDQKNIWRTGTDQKGTSYPEDSHDILFQVEDSSFWFNHRNRVIYKALQKIPNISQKLILDVGGGNGAVAKFLQNKGLNVVLVEPNYIGCQNARSRGVLNVIQGKTSDLKDLPQGTVVCMFDVIEHIESPEKFLSELVSFLPADGKIVFTVPTYKWLWSHEDVIAGHFTRYTRKSVRSLLSKADLIPSFISYFFSFLILPIFLLRVLPEFFFGPRQFIQTETAHSKPSALLDFVCKAELKAMDYMPFGSSLIAICRLSDK